VRRVISRLTQQLFGLWCLLAWFCNVRQRSATSVIFPFLSGVLIFPQVKRLFSASRSVCRQQMVFWSFTQVKRLFSASPTVMSAGCRVQHQPSVWPRRLLAVRLRLRSLVSCLVFACAHALRMVSSAALYLCPQDGSFVCAPEVFVCSPVFSVSIFKPCVSGHRMGLLFPSSLSAFLSFLSQFSSLDCFFSCWLVFPCVPCPVAFSRLEFLRPSS